MCVGDIFIFTDKAHKDISHIHKFKLKREAVEKFEKLVDICKILKAEIIVLQVPYRQKPSSRFLKNLVKFLLHLCGVKRKTKKNIENLLEKAVLPQEQLSLF